jgi:hypothetical protein
MNSIRAIILAGVSQLVTTTAFAAPENAVIRANAAAGWQLSKRASRQSVIRSMSHVPTR